jgi:MFS family permease
VSTNNAAAEGMTLPKPPSVFRDATYMRLWTAFTLSMFGSNITMTVLPILAAATLHASPLQMSVLWFVDMLPAVIIAPFAGVFADRMRPRPILIASDLFRCSVLLAIPFAFLIGQLRIEIVYVTMFGLAVGDIWFDVAQSSYVPSLLSNERLIDANSKLQMSSSAAVVAGPGITGVLIGIVGAPLSLLADAVSYVVSAILIATMADVAPPPTAEDAKTVSSIFTEMRAGFQFVCEHELLRGLTLRLAAWQFVSGGMYSMVILYTISVLGAAPALAGLLFSVLGVGFFVAATSAKRVADWIGVGPAIIVTNLVGAYTATLLPLASGHSVLSLAMVTIAMFVYGVCVTMYGINNISLRQAITPPPLRGRVMAAMRSMTLWLSALGAVVTGSLAVSLGLRGALACFAVLGVTFATVGAFSKPLRTLRVLPKEVASDA